MSYQFGERSRAALVTCDRRLQMILTIGIEHTPIDFSLLEGLRSTERQQRLYAIGASQRDGITRRSAHQANEDGLSEAIDIAPFPIDWQDLARFHIVAGVLLSVASANGLPLTWGGDWDGDGDLGDQRFNDLGHFELGKVNQ